MKFDTKFLEPTQNSHDIGLTLASELNTTVNTILIQVETGL
jgi:hypothetical protein